MDPYEFCEKYCSKQPDEWGWKTEAIALLAQTTGSASSSIEKWGVRFENAPPYVSRLLQKEDVLREICNQVKRL
jgi:hypothetical protein